MDISLTFTQAATILEKFRHPIPPRPGRGFLLAGDAGAIEHDARGYHWRGTESELVRLSKRLGLLRTANPMTLAHVRNELAKVNISITSLPWHNEYRVNYKRGREATAYYTSDLEDAYHTGLVMAREKSR